MGTECLNTRFPVPTLLCAGYSVKLIYVRGLDGWAFDRQWNELFTFQWLHI